MFSSFSFSLLSSMDGPQFVHSSFEHLGCCLLGVINWYKVIFTLAERLLCECMFLFLLRRGLLGWMASVCLTVWEIQFIHILPSCWHCPFSFFFKNFFSLSSRYGVVSTAVILCFSLMTYDMLAPFHVLIYHLSSFSKRPSPSLIFNMFAFWLIFDSSLYVLNTSLYQKCDLQICSTYQFVVYLFHSHNSVFQRANVFNFDEVQYIHFLFYGWYLEYCP